jgi:hypothetical protein
MSVREKELPEIRQTIEIRYRDYRRRGLLLDADTLTYLAAYEDGLLLPPEQAAFVKSSREAAERKRRRRLTLAFSTLILVLLVVSGLGGLAYFKAIEARHQAAEASQQRAEAKRQADKAERQAADAARKEKDARHNLGLAFVEKAERSVADKRFNEARLYALHALADLDPQRPGPETATGFVLGNPVFPPAFACVNNTYHEGSVTSVRCSPNGQTFASGSADKTIRLWDLATGNETAVLVGHADAVISLSFAPDGRALVSASWDHSIRLWDLSFLQDPRPIEQRFPAAERRYKLLLVDLDLQPIFVEPSLCEVRPEPPSWPESHPLHRLPSAEKGGGHAVLNLGVIYDRADDLPRAETWYRKAAEAGEPTAKERLDNVLRHRAAALSKTMPQGDTKETQ